MSGGGTPPKKQLGKILLTKKLVTPDELQDLLHRQRQNPGQRLASTAIQSGMVKEVDLLKALSEQLGLPGIDLAQVVIPLSNLQLIPREIARQHLILPILVKDDRVFLAMADPNDKRVIDEIEFVSGRRVYPYVALHEALTAVIDDVYRRADSGEEFYVGPNVPQEYLRQIGLAEEAEPAPGRGAAVVDRELPTAAIEDDVGVELVRRRGPDLGADFDEEAPTKRAPRARPKVLIVDDEDDIRRLLKRVLGEKGYDVVEAGKGLEALQLVRSESPDLILLDAMLPEVHGFDICRRIKGSKRYGGIPIIMVSAIYRGWRFAEDLKASYGVDSFLEKPFKIGDVLQAVERALAGRTSSPPAGDDDLSREAGGLLQQGMDAYQKGDIEAAIRFLQSGLSVDPLSFQLHYHLGLLYGRRENVFEAIHELETAVDLQPKNFAALKNLAVLYQRAGFKHKAIEMWERALGNAPDDETKRGIKDHLMSLL